jgi:hypothetical protein
MGLSEDPPSLIRSPSSVLCSLLDEIGDIP